MPRFDKPRNRENNDFDENKSYKRKKFFDKPRSDRSSDRDSKMDFRKKRNLEMTEVTCSSCGIKCEVPFKPDFSKPVYCKDCYSSNDKSNKFHDKPRGQSSELDVINEKLDKIMNALKIR